MHVYIYDYTHIVYQFGSASREKSLFCVFLVFFAFKLSNIKRIHLHPSSSARFVSAHVVDVGNHVYRDCNRTDIEVVYRYVYALYTYQTELGKTSCIQRRI